MDGNRYHVREAGKGVVEIIDPSGEVVHARACGSEDEARTYASTVRQHIGWLSEARFREYYRLPEQGG